MGFVTNRWQPVNASPGPTPIDTNWKLLETVSLTANTPYALDTTQYTDMIILYSNCSTYFPLSSTPISIRNGNSRDKVQYQFTVSNTSITSATSLSDVKIFCKYADGSEGSWVLLYSGNSTSAQSTASIAYKEIIVDANWYTGQNTFVYQGGGANYIYHYVPQMGNITLRQGSITGVNGSGARFYCNTQVTFTPTSVKLDNISTSYEGTSRWTDQGTSARRIRIYYR